MQAAKQKKKNPVAAYFSAYFHDFGLRQIATILMLVSAIVALIGVCIPHEITLLVGLYVYAAASALGAADCIRTMAKVRHRKAPPFRRAVINLVITLVSFGIAVAGICVTHILGIYA